MCEFIEFLIGEGMELLPIIKDLAIIAGSMSAIYIGFSGLYTWKRQTIGTTKFEVARQIIKTSYEIEHRIDLLRAPLIILDADEVKESGEISTLQKHYDERYNKIVEKWVELETLNFEAQAIWGDVAKFSIEKLDKAIRNLKGDLWLFFWLKGAYAGPGATVDDSPERVEEVNKVIYKTSEKDEFSLEVKAAIKQVEDFYRQELENL
ncbi:MAG: hypothetical protein ACRBBJ_15065 [Rhodomicrobiaceae bacterium]